MTLMQRRRNVDATSWCCIDVEATLCKRYVLTGNSVKSLIVVHKRFDSFYPITHAPLAITTTDTWGQ